MKKTIATLCLVGSTIALSACGSTDTGHIDSAPPYAMERTATHESEMVTPTEVAPAERVFQRAQTK